jgi:hypothetical protein
MSNLKWLSDSDLIMELRKEEQIRRQYQLRMNELHKELATFDSYMNNSNTRSVWAMKYLMQDLTGTSWENDVQGWVEQRARYNGKGDGG